MTRPVRIVVVGDVDHGKSTLLGRLLHETRNLPDGKIEEIKAACGRRKVEMEWSFLLDAFQAERDQAVTIDAVEIRVGNAVLIDTPGHREFIRNMITGAAQADAALLVLDVMQGLAIETKDRMAALALMGIKKFIVALSKMDAVNYSEEAFNTVAAEIAADMIIPVAAKTGEMLASRGKAMEWYKGPVLLDAIEDLKISEDKASLPLRFVVQDVCRLDGRRIIMGRVEAGALRVSDEILFSPYNQQARVKTIEIWPENPGKAEARAGECIGITLDRDIFIERGHVASDPAEAPKLSPVFRARVFRVPEREVEPYDIFKACIGLVTVDVTVQSVDNREGRVVDLTLRANTMLTIDPGAPVVLLTGGELFGSGILSMEGYPDLRRGLPAPRRDISPADHLIDSEDRSALKGHRGGVFWLTGLSAAGKTTIAMAVEKALFQRGYHTYVLDGDNMRHGLTADLGFSPEDRAENIRRAGHVAALMADAGLVVIAAFISPYRSDREDARAAAEGRFHEIYIKADIDTCEVRDPKNLYKKARAGKINDFTGIDSPYEAPESADLVVDTQHETVEECVRRVLDFIEKKSVREASGKEKSFAVQ